METKTRTTTRRTRDQSTREAVQQENDLEFDASFLFEESGPLPNIPARPGYSQYWVRAKRGREDDARNLLRLKRRGWQPRSADTVPKGYQDLVSGSPTTGVVSTEDLILMERPAQLQEKVIAHNRKVVDERESAVKRNIFRDHQKLGGTDTGFSEPVREDRARVERGKPPVLDDE